jgi:outer membrane immunogenic protein
MGPMKRILAGLLVVSSATAFAVSLSAPASANDWEGFSVGIGGGYGMAKNDFDIGTGPAISSFLDANIAINGFGGSGGFFTLGAGYDHVLFGPLVVGAFIDYDFSDIDTNIGAGSRLGNIDANINFKIENQLSIGGRLGYLVAPTTLFFSTFGYAHAESSDITARLSSGGISGGGTLAGVGSFDGYFLGGGVETLISNGFSIKAEYRYTSLRAEDLDILPGSGASDFITGSIKPQIQTGRVSLNYRFGNGQNEAPDNSIPPVTSSWTSAYLGVGGGYGVAKNTLELADRSQPDPGSLFSAGIPFGHDGGILFATVGYDYQISPSFVIGAFGDADYSHLQQGNNLTLSLGEDAEVRGGTNTEFKNMLMVGGRLGYLVRPDTMLFVSGGYANVEADDTHLYVGASVEGIDIGGGGTTLISGRRFDGGFIGGGVETRLNDYLSLKAEYRYIDLGSETVKLLPNDLPEINEVVSTKFDPDIQMGRLSINYRFGGTTAEAETPLK